MKTGRDARQAGVYSSECCVASINVIEGQMLPRCPVCNALTDWEFVRRNARQGRKHEFVLSKTLIPTFK
jgi:hypothetical protein